MNMETQHNLRFEKMPSAFEGGGGGYSEPRKQVELRSIKDFSVPIVQDATFVNMAYFWNFVVQNVKRYTGDSLKDLRMLSQERLAEMGVDREALKTFAEAGIVEIYIPYLEEKQDWAARITPWESLLSLATKEWRGESGERRLTVIRHLDVLSPRTSAPPIKSPIDRRLLFVASEPGHLAGKFEFKYEYQLAQIALALESEGTSPGALSVATPSLDELREHLQEFQPSIIHLAGFDSHQSADIETKGKTDQTIPDGFMLADENRAAHLAESVPLGEALTLNGTFHPYLVSFNCFYSGSRLAALAVAAGARMAVGFQNVIDDTLAEQFYSEFYTRLRKDEESNGLRAFAGALRHVRKISPAYDSGDIVMWSHQSLLPKDVKSFFVWLNPQGIVEDSAAPAPGPTTSSPAKPPTVVVEPLKALNYSLLHNKEAIFSEFKIQRTDENVQSIIDVHVDLYVGEHAFPFRSRRILDEAILDLRSAIHVPLVAEMLRGRRESIHTSLFVEVTEGEHILYQRTHRITLFPADQWRDDPAERHWLPCFVLPRDPAVVSILKHAKRYLQTLADNSNAGFDGYQPLLRGFGVEAIDLQVRAIWAAILHESPLTYINPPPTYEKKEQRVRTPSMILEERSGTCLDLALLLASCLEKIGLHPVLFLTEGHAFAGYWRNPNVNLVARPENAPETNPVGQLKAWIFSGMGSFAQITQWINAGDLVPIETVQLAKQGAFFFAVEEGGRALVTTPWNFHAMVDLYIARDKEITPLPLSLTSL